MKLLRIVPVLAAVLVAAGAAQSRVIAAPQGTIVFQSDRSGHYEIYSAWADGTLVGQLTQSDDTASIWPEFSPDGRRIAFARGRVQGGRLDELWLMNAD